MGSEHTSELRAYGTGVYRREIRIDLETGAAAGELIDDFHHFRAHVRHDGRRVLEVRGEAVRFPWSTCPDADGPLRGLVGMALSGSALAAGRVVDTRAQCTHMFDAASIAIARAGRGAPSCVYQAAVPDRVDSRTRATLRRNGTEVLVWDLVDEVIQGPAPFAGRRLIGGGLGRLAETELDPDAAEAAMVLQRACVIALGRANAHELDSTPVASEVRGGPAGLCHSFSAEISPGARRILGTVRDFTHADRLT